MNLVDAIFLESLERILRDHCSPHDIRRYERGGSTDAVWRHLAEQGYPDGLLAESQGGIAMSGAAFARVLLLSGKYLLPVPLAETMVARAVIMTAGQVPPLGALAMEGGQLVSRAFNTSPASIAPWPNDALPLLACGAALRAGFMVGAMHEVLSMTLDYANSREQFGRPIGKFQVIQQALAEMAELVSSADMAVQLAFAENPIPTLALAALAKQRASATSSRVVATAHAIHGAMGLTEEYDLQLYVRRLHVWRLADGSESYWARRLGEECMADGGDSLDFVRRHLSAANVS